MSKRIHEINQPLAAIGNYASAAKMLLEQRLRSSTPLTEDDIQKIIQWMEQISNQTFRLGKLFRVQDDRQVPEELK